MIRSMLAGGAGSAVLHAMAFGGFLLIEPAAAHDQVLTIDLTIMASSETAGAPVAQGTSAAATVSPPAAAPRRKPAPHVARKATVSAVESAPPSHDMAVAANEEPSPRAVPAERPAAESSPAGASSATATAPHPGGAGPASPQQAYLAKHYGYIREAIQRSVSYPGLARRRGWAGRVVLSFRILPDGAVAHVRVTQGSGFEVLDASAVEAVLRASPFPPPPAEADIVAPVAYSLE